MSKVISVNSGSSSLKFQLFDMPNETVLTSGVAERIGQKMGLKLWGMNIAGSLREWGFSANRLVT